MELVLVLWILTLWCCHMVIPGSRIAESCLLLVEEKGEKGVSADRIAKWLERTRNSFYHRPHEVSSQLDCWFCDYNTQCNDPFDQGTNRSIVSVMSEMEGSPCVYCAKIKTKEYGYHHVERGCITESTDYITHELECSENIIDGVTYTYCYCDEALCNNSPLTVITPFLFIAPLSVWFLFKVGY